MHNWEKKIDINRVFTLQATRPLTYFGVGALAKLEHILTSLFPKERGKLLVVTDPLAYKASGAWDTVRPLLDRLATWKHFEGARPNPTFANCDAAAAVGSALGAQAVLAIGGGSAMDTAKTAAVLLAHPSKRAVDFYEKNAPIKAALPIVAINTTHGTGSECGSFAMAQSDGEDKPAIHSPHLYPTFTIDDPALTVSLPRARPCSWPWTPSATPWNRPPPPPLHPIPSPWPRKPCA